MGTGLSVTVPRVPGTASGVVGLYVAYEQVGLGAGSRACKHPTPLSQAPTCDELTQLLTTVFAPMAVGSSKSGFTDGSQMRFIITAVFIICHNSLHACSMQHMLHQRGKKYGVQL